MRKTAVIAGVLAAGLAAAPSAFAANTYTLTQARVSPAKSGTTAKPRPIRIDFGFNTASNPPGNRPVVTTDYVIGFGPGVRANHKLLNARTRRPAFARCLQRNGSTNTCPASTKVGSGIVENLAGAASDQSQQIPCRLNLVLYAGDGKLFPPAQNDGKRIRADMWLGLKGGPSITGCPLQVDAAIAAQFVRYKNGTALAFHVPKIPFQEPATGIENAVISVTASLFKTKRVPKRVRVGGRTRFVNTTRGFLESTRCPTGGHPVEVRFTNRVGEVSTASRRSACRR